MRYRDFDLWIDNRAGDHHPLRAACPAQGEARDRTVLDGLALPELAERLAAGETGRDLLTGFGALLYRALFDAEKRDIASLFDRCRGACDPARDEGLRIRLRIEPPAVAHLPWELLYSRRDQQFLATDAATALVRYLEVPQPIRSLATEFPIRMMVVIPDVQDLDVAAERRILEDAVAELERKKLVTLTWLDGVVPLGRVGDALVEERFHLLHFIGHGGFEADRSFLLFSAGGGGEDRVGHERFASLFRNHPTMKLVVLNSCQGAEVSSTEPLVGMAPELVKRGIPAVVAMKFPIPDRAAILFAREFYGCLFKGPERGRLEVAICHARNRLAAEFPGDRVVATPVLFTRAPAGVLFDLLTGRRLQDTPFSPRRLAGVEAVVETHQANLALAQGEDEKRAEIEELDRVRRRLRFRNRSLASTAAIALFLFFLSWLRVFDRLPAELKLQSYARWAGDAMRRKEFSDHVVLVATRQEIDRSWRRRHAALLDRLSTAGAAVAVFDVTFREPRADDAEFAAAIRRAARRGTAVVVAVDRLEDSNPGLAPALREAQAEWGVACIGRQGLPSSIVPLVTWKAGSAPSAAPALALAAVRAFARAHPGRVPAAIAGLGSNPPAGGRRPPGFSEIENVRLSHPHCPAIAAGDRVGTRILDISPRDKLRRRTLRYEDLEASPPATAAAALRGKIVMIGEQSGREERYVLRGVIPESRYGMELHADAVNTLLSGVTVRPLGSGWQFALTVLLAAVGATLAALAAGSRRSALARSTLGAAVLLYLAASVGLYVARQLMLNTVFHLGALLLTYWIVARLRRRCWL